MYVLQVYSVNEGGVCGADGISAMALWKFLFLFGMVVLLLS